MICDVITKRIKKVGAEVFKCPNFSGEPQNTTPHFFPQPLMTYEYLATRHWKISQRTSIALLPRLLVLLGGLPEGPLEIWTSQGMSRKAN